MTQISDYATAAGRSAWWWDAQIRLAIRTHHRDPERLTARLNYLLWLAEHSNIRSPR